MNAPPRVCPRCGRIAAPDARRCAYCGAVVDEAGAAELRQLYATLLELDALIEQGQGERTVQAVRDETHARYLVLHAAFAPPAAARSSAAAPTAPAPASPSAPDAAPGSALHGPVPAWLQRPAGPTPDAAGPADVAAAPRPAGTAFSWQAFLADQAIAIMAYLGGFLLLVATLTFEVGGWQVLGNGIKFGVVCGVYLVFGALGALLRRSPRLGTVARIYLGIFALLTPLVALAAYRFELQATGFPASGML